MPVQQSHRSDGQQREAVTVVLADQAVLMHIALRALLSGNSRYSIVAAARTACGAEQLVRRARPGLLISDTEIVGESGIELCRRTRHVSTATRVVILTNRQDPLLARAAIVAGAVGYLLKDTMPEIITGSLDGVLAGAVVVDPRLGTPRAAPPSVDPFGDVGFSRREREVLSELVRGLDNKAIAYRLYISEDTVKSHMKAIFRKLGARDRAHAVAIALGTAVPGMFAKRGVPCTAMPRRRDGL